MDEDKERLLFQVIIEILESIEGQPNKYTRRRLIEQMSKYAYVSSTNSSQSIEQETARNDERNAGLNSRSSKSTESVIKDKDSIGEQGRKQ